MYIFIVSFTCAFKKNIKNSQNNMNLEGGANLYIYFISFFIVGFVSC